MAMSDFSAAQVAIAGEALIDLIARPDGAFEPCLGGAVYNLSRAISRQGVSTTYLNPFASDRFGRALVSQIQADGVRLAHPQPVAQATSLAVVSLNEQGHPDYAFYREGVADRQVSAEGLNADCAALPDLQCVCTGGLALDARDASVYLPWLVAQRAAGRRVAVDANLRPSVMPDLRAYQVHVQQVLAQADLVKVSDEDLAHLEIPGATPLLQAEALMGRMNADWLALTLGEQGAWLLARDGRRWFAREGAPLDVIDTVGAGDSFFAGLLSSLLRHGPGWALSRGLGDAAAAQALRHAVACASLCVQQRGCVPPSWQQAQDWALAHPAVTVPR